MAKKSYFLLNLLTPTTLLGLVNTSHINCSNSFNICTRN